MIMKNLKAYIVNTSNNRLIMNQQKLNEHELIKRKKLSQIVGRDNFNNIIIAELCEIENVS